MNPNIPMKIRESSDNRYHPSDTGINAGLGWSNDVDGGPTINQINLPYCVRWAAVVLDRL